MKINIKSDGTPTGTEITDENGKMIKVKRLTITMSPEGIETSIVLAGPIVDLKNIEISNSLIF
jgi:hypothetical protein